MVESIEWLRAFILNYPSFEYIIVFLGAVLGGEPALFLLGFLAAQGVVSVIAIVVLSYVGAFIPNAIWYFLGNTHMIQRLSSHRYTTHTVSVITEAVERASRGSHLLALIIIKFLVGTPVLLVMYTSKTKLSIKEFFYYQSVATLLSVMVIMPAGYLSGRGFTYFTQVFENVYAAIGFILAILIILMAIQVWFEKRFTKEV